MNGCRQRTGQWGDWSRQTWGDSKDTELQGAENLAGLRLTAAGLTSMDERNFLVL